MTMKLTALVLGALAASAASAAAECQPMTTDDERIAYWCRTYPGQNCEAVGRQNLPYISDYADCPDVDSAGRPIEHDRCADFSPLPPDCVGAQPTPAPTPAPPATKPGGSSPGGGAGSGSGPACAAALPSGLRSGKGGSMASEAISGAACAPGGAGATSGGEGSMPVPANCAPIQRENLTVYRNFNCSCANHTSCGYAPVSWGPAGGEGQGVAWAFKPKTGGGHSGFVGTPSVPSSHFCVVKMEILDKDGRSTGCQTRGGTGPSPTELRFTGASSGAGGCKLTAGAQYFFAYTLIKRVPSPHTAPGYENYCGMVYEHAYNVDEDL